MDPIAQAQEQGLRAGIHPDILWLLTPWELNQCLLAKQNEITNQFEIANLMLVANAWHTGKYVRMDRFPQSLAGELNRIAKGSDAMTPEESADHMRSYLNAVSASNAGVT